MTPNSGSNYPEMAQLDESGMASLRALEDELGVMIVALKPAARVAQLEARQLERLVDAERQLGVTLVAYQNPAEVEAVEADPSDFGPLAALVDDPAVSQIMAVGHAKVYAERDGTVELTSAQFTSEEHLRLTIDRLLAAAGARIDARQPIAEGRLADGTRINAVIPPAVRDGCQLTILKSIQSKALMTAQDFVELGTASGDVMEFLAACVAARLNVIISGGGGGGKTTLLNILASAIPPHERIVTIENGRELRLHQDHVVRLLTVAPDSRGGGGASSRDLLMQGLLMRPDRVIVGQLNGPETFNLIEAINAGHDGSLATIHSNSPRDALVRLETLYQMAGVDMPLSAIRERIAAAVQVIVQIDRLRDGLRRIVRVAEGWGMEGDVITLYDLFKFEQASADNNRITGELKPTGTRPTFIDKIAAAGIELPPHLFGGK